MKLTKEEVTKRVEEILDNKESKDILVSKLLESGLFDDVLKKEKELEYEATHFIENGEIHNDISGTYYIKDTDYFDFGFTSRKTAELWAKKLSALNKLRMIKELIDDNKGNYAQYVYKITYNLHSKDFSVQEMHKPSDKNSSFTIIFSNHTACFKAIELMGKEALDDLFLNIN